MSINLLLGHTAMGVPVTAANTSNPHLYVTGRSGSGKSYFLKGLLAQASTQGALCLVFDYTGDYRTNDFLNEPLLKRVSVASPDFTLNPFWGTTIHSPELLAQQFLSLVHTTFRLGSRASMTLRRSVIDYLRSGTDVPSLQGLAEYMGQLETHSQALDTALDRCNETRKTQVSTGKGGTGRDFMGYRRKPWNFNGKSPHFDGKSILFLQFAYQLEPFGGVALGQEKINKYAFLKRGLILGPPYDAPQSRGAYFTTPSH